MQEELDSQPPRNGWMARDLGNTLGTLYLGLRSRNLSRREAWQLVEHCVSQAYYRWLELEPPETETTGPTNWENESQEE